MSFDDRDIDKVVLTEIMPIRAGGEEMFSANVHVALTTSRGGPDGPSIQLVLAAPVDMNGPYIDMERSLMGRVIDLCRRIAEESPETLHAAWIEWSEKAGQQSYQGPIQPEEDC